MAKIDLTPFPAMIHDLYVKLIELNLSTDDICELYSLAISLSSGGRSRETLSFQVRQNMDSSRATRDNNLKFTTRLLIKAGRDQLQEAIAALSAGGLDVPVRP
ncbi:MAG: hypothetical protein LBI20_00585 [Holosporales bacterium]|nr:hypothetical protein [Holosporales bacterium]